MNDMTYEKALKLLNDMQFKDEYQGKDEYMDMLLACKQALDKQIPKKPLEQEVIGVSMTGYKYRGYCSRCALTVSQYRGNYCPNCGQALDWSEIE